MKNFFNKNAGVLVAASIVSTTIAVNSYLDRQFYQSANGDPSNEQLQEYQSWCVTENIIHSEGIDEYLKEYGESISHIGYADDGVTPILFVTKDGQGQNWSVLTSNDDGSMCLRHGGSNGYESYGFEGAMS